jgi:hypothetical protein
VLATVGHGHAACVAVYTAGETAMFAVGARLGVVETGNASDGAGPCQAGFVGGGYATFHAVDYAVGGGSQGLLGGTM